MRYLHRIADDVLKERLEAFGAVLVEGPKWCGKTTTSFHPVHSLVVGTGGVPLEEFLSCDLSALFE